MQISNPASSNEKGGNTLHPVAAYFENLVWLLSCRSPDEVLAQALSCLIDTLGATAGSILFTSIPSKRYQQGVFADEILERIAYLEDSLLIRLREQTRQIALPSIPPVARYPLPDQGQMLLHVPLIGEGRIYGSVSIVLPLEVELDERQELLLSQFISGVTAATINVERLAVTRRRLSQLGLFYQIGQAMTSTIDVDRLFQDTIELAVAIIGAQAAVWMRLDRQHRVLVHECTLGGTAFAEAQYIGLHRGVVGWVAQHQAPVLLNHAAQDPRFDPLVDGCQERTTLSLLCVPLQIKGQVIGVLELLNKVPDIGFDAQDQSILITLAAQASLAADNARLYNSLQAERERIMEAQENVRHELARNLHDGPVQLLASISMELDWLERVLKVHPEAFHDELESLRRLSQQAMQDARMLLFELRPLVLETQGLVPALESYVQRLADSGRCTPHLEAETLDQQLDIHIASTLFAIVQEAVTNTAKHAQADNVWIRLYERDGQLIVSVEDDGRGFDMTSIQARYDQGSSLGLLNMRERAELINAELIIKSGPPRKRPGTLIQIRMPYPPAQE